MIQNAKTATHDMYLRGRRGRKVAQKPIQPEPILLDGVRPDRNGPFAERCAWMKLRQQKRARG